MNRVKTGLSISLAATLIFLAVLPGCSGRRARESSSIDNSTVSGKVFYTKYNLHTYSRGRDQRIATVIHYINCPGHSVLPYNTAVAVKKTRSGFELLVKGSGQVIYYEFKQKYANMSKDAYIALVLSNSQVNYPELSDIDQKGIREGRPIKGMSKEGIMVALGYPAPAYTSSLKNDTWQYWNSRFIKCIIDFKDGKAVTIRRR